MEVNGKVHCLFEQSGTFKNEFKKLGYQAEDYDIQNNFGETDHVIDLFNEIENGCIGKPSIFDSMCKNDLVIAFFPCIYFEGMQMMYFQLTHKNTSKLTQEEKIWKAIERLEKRSYFHTMIYKLVIVCEKKGLRLIIENPATPPSYLMYQQNFPNPSIIDKNRMLRGDFFKKPTAYWFFGCKPTEGCFTRQEDKVKKTICKSNKGKEAGICSEERSMISPDYARNFIKDFILGTGDRTEKEGFLF